jgi:hypothetical protein
MTDSEHPESPPDTLPRFQFSLRSQMIAVTVVAVLLGLGVVGGDRAAWVLFYAIVYCLVPTPLIIAAIFGHGELRTFSVGALVPWISAWSRVTPLPLILYPQNLTLGALLGLMVGSAVFMAVMAAACGALAVAVQRWLKRTGTDREPPQRSS